MAWQAHDSGLTRKGIIPQYPSKMSRACLVMVTRFSQESRLPDKSIATGRSEVKCQAPFLVTVENFLSFGFSHKHTVNKLSHKSYLQMELIPRDEMESPISEKWCDTGCSCTEDGHSPLHLGKVLIVGNFTVLTCQIAAKLLKTLMPFLKTQTKTPA